MPSSFSISIYLSLVASAYAAANFSRRADGSEFQADASIDVDAIYKAVQAGVAAKNNVLATYPTCNDCDSSTDVDLIGDWMDVSGVEGTFSFMADMDVDCDGVAWQCPGNPDGQPQTSFGAMDATQAPWYVIPEEFYQRGLIQPNALGAVICFCKNRGCSGALWSLHSGQSRQRHVPRSGASRLPQSALRSSGLL